MQTLRLINYIISIIFLICYAYQFAYIPIALGAKARRRSTKRTEEPSRSYAVLIAARNEEKVLPDLLNSIREQDYPRDKITVFVIADNCTDGTAEAARALDAVVYERQNKMLVGKGYALAELLRSIRTDYPAGFDGYFVFDADNLLAPDYFTEMDRKFGEGCDIVTSYRNSKNFDGNWISSGYALWFLRESRFMNGAREAIGSSCHVTGTGFLFSRAVLEETGGWPYHLLTEDLEFSVDRILHGRRIAYCDTAELYDEQPTTFRASWHQRCRWTKGYLQVVKYYGGDLIRQALKGSWSCFDIAMSIMPAFVLSFLSLICNVLLIAAECAAGGAVAETVRSTLELIGNSYLTLFILGAVTTVTEWSRIRTSWQKKILSMFTFPLFMSTYIPVSVGALFSRPEWRPIPHTVTAAQMRSGQKQTVYKKAVNL